jgi:hypothetical protein
MVARRQNRTSRACWITLTADKLQERIFLSSELAFVLHAHHDL